MKVYDFPLSPNSQKVRAVSYELGLEPEFIRVDLFKGEQKSPEILALNPNGRADPRRRRLPRRASRSRSSRRCNA